MKFTQATLLLIGASATQLRASNMLQLSTVLSEAPNHAPVSQVMVKAPEEAAGQKEQGRIWAAQKDVGLVSVDADSEKYTKSDKKMTLTIV